MRSINQYSNEEVFVTNSLAAIKETYKNVDLHWLDRYLEMQ